MRRRLLSVALELLNRASADCPREPISVVLRCGETLLRYRASPAEAALLAASAGLPEMQQNILQALEEAGREVGPKELARRAGYTYGPRFRSATRALLELGLIRRGLDGYVLARPPNENRHT